MPELADFRLAVDTLFSLRDGSALRLVDARGMGEHAAATDRHPFRLEFVGPVDPILPQRTYRLEHVTLGTLDIFLVPIGRDASGTTHEAIFA